MKLHPYKVKSPPLFTEKRIPSLDGWRAVAILLVLLSHTEQASGFPVQWKVWWSYLFPGNLGVRLFFVISGFLITFLLLLEANRSGQISLRGFYFRRVLRIFPVYFLYLAVLAVLSIGGYYSDSLFSWIGALTFTRNMVGHGGTATAHLWSLAVEEQFYLAWPLCLVLFSLWRRPKTALILLLLVLAACPYLRTLPNPPVESAKWYERPMEPYSILLYADSLAVGCLGAFIYRDQSLQLSRLGYDRLIFGAFFSIILLEYTKYLSLHHSVVEAFIPGIEAIAMMFALYASIENRSGLIFAILNAPIMVWIGVLSYSIYIWHFLFVSDYAGPHLRKLFFYDWHVWWIPAIFVSTLSYYFIEKPILRLKAKRN